MNLETRLPTSVVIPTYAGQALLEKHFPDILSQLQAGDEIVVVDDASPEPDMTPAWCERVGKILLQHGISLIFVQHTTNQRFAAAVNTGVDAAQHPFVWLLNNDVSPLTPDSVVKLQSHFQSDPLLFSVGCAEIQSLDEDPDLFGRGTGNYQRGLLVHWYDPNQSSPTTLWTAGGSMFFDREKFLELGGMDTRFAPAYEEDRDLSYRALKRGWNLRHDVEVIVHHQHETTNKTVFGDRGIAEASWKNQFLLVWKNITDWNLLLQHLLWLPYHLTVSNRRETGAVWIGFKKAWPFIGGILTERRRNRDTQQRTDRQVLETFGAQPPKPNQDHQPANLEQV